MSRYSNTRDDDRDALLDDLEDDMRHNTGQDLRATVTQLQARVEVLEQTVRNSGRPTEPSATAAGEAVLAKAVGAFGDALLAYADRQVSDPTTVGIISGHVAAGDIQAAKMAVLEYVQRGALVAKADDMTQVVNTLDSDLAGFDNKAAVSELTARFASVERLLANFEARLTMLERRPQNVPAPVVPPAPNTVAKAAGPRRPKTQEETAEELLSQVNAYVDNVTTTGVLSSMIAAGQFKQVRAALASAKRSHEEQRLIHERKGFNQS